LKSKICHFSSVHSIIDTRVFYRECVSTAIYFDVTLIAIGNFSGNKNGVKIIGINKPKTRIERAFGTIFKVFYLALKVDANIYHIHDAEMLPFGLLLSILGKKVIYDIHENTKQDILLKPWIPKSKLIASFYDSLLKFSNNYLHYIPVVANPSFLPIFHVNPNQYTVIQNFADYQQMLKYKVSNRDILPGNHIFYVGMIKDMYYDINVLINALNSLKNNGKIYYLHCVGYFGSRTDNGFESNPNYLNVKNQIHFYGYLDFDTAYKISMQCKVGICLKNQPESMLVSHERKFFEYISISLPSVFCNSKIYTDVLNKYQIGIAVNLANSNEIALAIEKLFEETEFYKNCLLSCGQAAHNEYNWEFEALKLIQLYNKLLLN
jgi:glycosyltransferase involved in cell wall biosynthesis